MNKQHLLDTLKASVLGLFLVGTLGLLVHGNQPSPQSSQIAAPSQDIPSLNPIPSQDVIKANTITNLELYNVVSVTDGDTIKVNYNGTIESVRLIGVNTPETVDPRKTVECFGKEASNYLKKLLTNKTVTLESDPSQSDRDKYNRLLRYVYLDGKDINEQIIRSGYGYEYTYNVPYAKQSLYKAAQAEASENGKGLWAENACLTSNETTVPKKSTTKKSTKKSTKKTTKKKTTTKKTAKKTTKKSTKKTTKKSTKKSTTKKKTSTTSSKQCKIKGNINKGQKIYHLPGQKFYKSTKINTKAGERWFCSEAEARAAGWRKSKV